MSKQAVFVCSILLSVPVFLSFLMAQPGEPLWLLLARALVLGLSAGGALLMGQSLLPDTIDFDYRRSGLRREGVFSAIYSFVEKASFAAGPLVVGILLSAFGYVPGRPGAAPVVQTHQAMLGITMGVAVIPAIASMLAVLVLRFYRLTQEELLGMAIATPVSVEHDA